MKHKCSEIKLDAKKVSIIREDSLSGFIRVPTGVKNKLMEVGLCSLHHVFYRSVLWQQKDVLLLMNIFKND